MKINASIESRMTSSRLPGKVLMPIGGKPALEIMIERVQQSQHINEIVIATTTNKEDDPVIELCEKLNVSYFRGSEENVFERVLKTHEKYETDLIVELTGDCPLLDPLLIDEAITCFLENDYDYVSNCIDFTYPLGMAVEVFRYESLKAMGTLNLNEEDREHVSVRFYHDSSYRSHNILAPKALYFPTLSITLDTQKDYEMISTVYNHFGHNNFSLKEIITFIKNNPHLLNINPVDLEIYK